ncbi:conserved membrane hypothetical protein [Candidatus Sulfotelmatomonas gaucii]|uniref:Glycosyltransferase RgtA/B/C/D-like domain-containing protein n=1 Tax=Candidatus Sulfuritelmatomonas gaucii TaxID=2043161 RepID=A0A2N9LFS5_9BACT|nr:conserved membrane hypothetical protein [Candidatus Sulfotelmatomonas gaucii]
MDNDAQSTRKTMRTCRSWFSNPQFLLALAAGLIAFVVQSGELGTSDTTHRLNATHAFWTSSPPVFPDEYPEFGVHGCGGKLQTWYGIGQSLLMLPQDMVGTAIAHLPIFARYGDDPSVRDIFVSYVTNMLLAVLTALVCFRFLRQLGFTVNHAVAGVLALLICTTHLHYTQNMMENNYIFLLTLTGFLWQYEWLQTGSRRALFWGSAAFGLNLLTRLTTGLDLVAGGLFVLLVLWWEKRRGRELWRRCRIYLATALPVYIFFGLLDRAYQFYRFGSFFNTYVSVVAKEARLRDPSLPANYPFETPFHAGFFGALFAPEKSIFLFDPLLILAILVAVIGWKRFSPAIRAYGIATLFMLLAYICFYARYTVWSGDFAWGDRYVSTSVELAALLAVPLLLRYRREFGRFVWGIGVFLVAASAVVQAASLAFWLPLEIYQMETLGHPTFVIALRIKNIVAFALGKMDAWGLNNHAMTEDPWDYVHITTWNILPWLLKRVGVAPAWVVHVAFAVWYAGLAALAGTLARLWIVTKRLGATPSAKLS